MYLGQQQQQIRIYKHHLVFGEMAMTMFSLLSKSVDEML